ncbi:MAG: folate family ECF transporter S component [Candidatus Izemoplasmatales bacterium]|jgi:ECF transporter S component (folate family)|nr:folate family ECF transporter S component [Candidatus Izemoplasmatales bacterium]MDD4355068.1 folate family ECF transporter S component [Candidatus Izemoplasmatales bacterium]NLF48123.1 folate family ECF transporter S component [Acholeplasmataceae bacterium]
MVRSQVQKMIFTGLMVAIGILLNQFIVITLPTPSDPIIKFGIGYLPIMLTSILYGPVYGLMAGISQDLLGFFLIGSGLGQTFHLGFTLNSVLYGLIPGLIFHLKFKKDQWVYFGLNVLLSIALVFGSFWYFFHLDQVIADTLTLTQKTLLSGLGIGGAMALLGANFMVFFSKKIGPSGPKLLFSIALLYILVSLILTPIWVTQINPGIPFWTRIPLRIVKMPIETSVYVVLCSILLKLLNTLMGKVEESA